MAFVTQTVKILIKFQSQVSFKWRGSCCSHEREVTFLTGYLWEIEMGKRKNCQAAPTPTHDRVSDSGSQLPTPTLKIYKFCPCRSFSGQTSLTSSLVNDLSYQLSSTRNNLDAIKLALKLAVVFIFDFIMWFSIFIFLYFPSI